MIEREEVNHLRDIVRRLNYELQALKNENEDLRERLEEAEAKLPPGPPALGRIDVWVGD